IQSRAVAVLSEINEVAKARLSYVKLIEKLNEIAKSDKKKDRRARIKMLRGWVSVSQRIRDIEFTETIKRRLVEEVKEAVEDVSKVQREADHLDRTLNPKV